MPIFMDRHDVSEAVTAELIAQLHQCDLKVQAQFGCRGLTYWFDEKRKTAFCLIEAPDAASVQKMHAEAHGEVPHRVIEVDAGVVESFLGRIEDPKKVSNTELNIIEDPGFRIIMVIMLQGSGPIKQDPAPFRSAFHNYHHEVLAVLDAREGKAVKQSVNYLLASFRSASHAVRAAFTIRQAFEKFRKGIDIPEMHIKIGLCGGSPVTEKKQLFEDAIKLAERMCKTVKGEIILSQELKELYNSENAEPLGGGDSLVCLSQADEQFLTLLMEYTELTWRDTDFQVDDFSKPVGCSKSQLYRKMIQLTGKSPNSFIREYRLHEALTLLNKNAGNISDIAFETGFSSPSYFSKCFQKRYGYSPSDHLAAQIA